MSKKVQNISVFDPSACETSLSNSNTYIMYFKRLMLIAMTMFEWDGIPNNIPQRWIERILNYYGMGAFANDPELGMIFLPCTPTGELNIYHEPVAYTLWSVNYSKVYPASDIVVVRNNFDNLATAFTLSQYAKRLAETERTCDINLNAQKTPLLLLCDESQKLTLKNMYSKFESNEDAIFGYKGIDPNTISCIKTEAPFLCDKLQFHKQGLWKEAMTFLGVMGDASQKRERLVTAEIEGMTDVKDFSLNIMLISRQIGIEECNAKFGTNLSCVINNYANKEIADSELIEELDFDDEEEGEENE